MRAKMMLIGTLAVTALVSVSAQKPTPTPLNDT